MLWHPHKSAGPDLDDARDGCPSADYLDGDSASCPALNSQNGVTVSHCPVTDHPAESCPLPRSKGDVGTGWAEHAHHSASRCPATEYQQASSPESCPLLQPQGDVGAGWPAHANQESNSISCPLFTTFQGSAAKDAAAAAAAAQDGTAAAAAACGKSVDLPIDAALVREPKAAAQLCAPAYLFYSGTTSKSNDSSKGAESAGLGRPLGSLARGRVSGSSSCSSIGTGPEGGRVSCSSHGTRLSSVLSTRCSSSSLLNRSSSLSSSTSVGMVGLFTRGSSCRDEEDVDNAVGEELEEDEGKSLPVLGPRHVGVMTQLLKDALVELDAKQELIDDMVRVISGASHLFERGDIFMDAHADEAKWQGLGAQEGLRRPFSNNGLQRRSSLKSPESSARLIKPRVSFKSTVGCAEGAAVRTSRVEADPEQERAREKLRNMFASW
ncbi:hypothetical protein DUNSADRAFT_11476 [Dunaliella salina]|uniref:Uncharacterized protein n=1 Tax=Dunaliella salina TaxID=3046 RepID=A0ABQ7GDA0_DUNSA|nr:hypothetical protein DUNSADRAFT_11476 [Dunaliella salina]|eukprot:KAF5832576.1 hypothetical protein DUNSADRAFT_11476 [Dunaliella salina]